MILGDSLLVMTSLAEKEGLKGQVQTIYIDPPYGIKFGSNWQVSTRKRDVRDGKDTDLTRQPEQVRAYRDTWELGIHSYLAYLRDRLVAARELLTESGSVFVQIGDENIHLVRSLLDEVFGRETSSASSPFAKTSGAGSFSGTTNLLASASDYVLWYARDRSRVKYSAALRGKAARRRRRAAVQLAGGCADGPSSSGNGSGGRWPRFRLSDLTSQTTREAQTTVFPVDVDGRRVPPAKGGWKTNRDGMTRLAVARV